MYECKMYVKKASIKMKKGSIISINTYKKTCTKLLYPLTARGLKAMADTSLYHAFFCMCSHLRVHNQHSMIFSVTKPDKIVFQ